MWRPLAGQRWSTLEDSGKTTVPTNGEKAHIVQKYFLTADPSLHLMCGGTSQSIKGFWVMCSCFLALDPILQCSSVFTGHTEVVLNEFKLQIKHIMDKHIVRLCFFFSLYRILILGGSGGVGTFAIQVCMSKLMMMAKLHFV